MFILNQNTQPHDNRSVLLPFLCFFIIFPRLEIIRRLDFYIYTPTYVHIDVHLVLSPAYILVLLALFLTLLFKVRACHFDILFAGTKSVGGFE